MPRFKTAPVEQVAPKRRQRQPSQRAQIRKQYEEALRDAMLYKHEALVVELDTDDKPLTVRNRIRRAADALGIDNIVIRRRRDKIVAYQTPDESSE
jgi:hypothetical protein